MFFSLKLQIVKSFTNDFSHTYKGFCFTSGGSRCGVQDLVTVTPFGEIVERYLSFVALLLDVIQNSGELIGRHEPGEHGYWLARRVQKDERRV